MDWAFDYVIKNPLDTEESYPYKAAAQKCEASGKGVGVITGYTDVTPNSVT